MHDANTRSLAPYEELRRSMSDIRNACWGSTASRSSVILQWLILFDSPALLPTPGPATNMFTLYLKISRSNPSFRFPRQKESPFDSRFHTEHLHYIIMVLAVSNCCEGISQGSRWLFRSDLSIGSHIHSIQWTDPKHHLLTQTTLYSD